MGAVFWKLGVSVAGGRGRAQAGGVMKKVIGCFVVATGLAISAQTGAQAAASGDLNVDPVPMTQAEQAGKTIKLAYWVRPWRRHVWRRRYWGPGPYYGDPGYYGHGDSGHYVGPPPNGGLSAATVRKIQRKLNELGYDAGTPDGVLGPSTRAAIRRFQAAQGLKVTGRIPAAQRKLLFSLQASSEDEVETPPKADDSEN